MTSERRRAFFPTCVFDAGVVGDAQTRDALINTCREVFLVRTPRWHNSTSLLFSQLMQRPSYCID